MNLKCLVLVGFFFFFAASGNFLTFLEVSAFYNVIVLFYALCQWKQFAFSYKAPEDPQQKHNKYISITQHSDFKSTDYPNHYNKTVKKIE